MSPPKGTEPYPQEIAVLFGVRIALMGLMTATTIGFIASPAAAQPTIFESARFCLVESDAPPELDPADPRCESIELPDRWSRRRPMAEGSGWYRFEIPPTGAQAGERWAVWLPRLNMNAEVFVDGQWVGSGGDFEPPVSQNWNRPLLFSFSGEALADGGVVDVRLYAYAGDWGGLDPIHVGPAAPLTSLHETRLAWQVVPAQIASVVAIGLAALFGALWWIATERRTMYGCALGAAVCYFVHSLAAHVREIGVPYELGRWLIHTTFDWFTVFMMLAFHRWSGVSRLRLERGIVLLAVTGSLSTALAGTDAFLSVAVVFHALTILLPIYALALLLQRFRATPRVERAVILAGTLLTVVVAIHALSIQLGVLPQSSPRLLHLLAPVLFTAFGAILLGDFVRTYREARALNRELDDRVRAKESELKRSFESVRRLQDQRVLATERERIMREMHDGLGSRLVSALSLADRGNGDGKEVSTALRGALLEMRIVIDSLDPSNDDLTTVLAMLRSRVEPSLRANGVRVCWEVSDLDREPDLGPRQLLHVLRVVQEAVTNALKHSGATQIRFITGTGELDDGRAAVFVRIADDGAGIDAGAPRGRGLRNMGYRAEQLTGRLDVEATEGTSITLWVPLTGARTSMVDAITNDREPAGPGP